LISKNAVSGSDADCITAADREDLVIAAVGRGAAAAISKSGVNIGRRQALQLKNASHDYLQV
jgi:hypothetical protein